MVNYSKYELSPFNGRILSPKVILIQPQSKFFTSNTLIFNDQVKLVVDTGFQHGSGQLTRVRDFFCIGSDDSIFFSHYHIDHIIGGHIFTQSSKLIHQSEKDAFESVEAFLQFCFQDKPSPSEHRQWKLHFITFLEYEGLTGWKDLAFNKIEWIDAQDPLDLGETSVDVLHLPGHSPGHCGLYESVNQILFIGDIDLSHFGPWYGWKNANLFSFRQSITHLRQFIKENEISWIVPSHSPPINNKQDCLNRLENFNKIFDERKKRILEFITQQRSNGTTIEAIAQQSFIYQGKISTPPYVFETFERIMVEHHLKELVLEGYVDFEGDKVFSK
ncbi:MAG: MBL fold metallo-hydrolase [Promethearchaeota archaeon]